MRPGAAGAEAACDLWQVFGLELEESAAMAIQPFEHAFDTPNRSAQ
jgi:hypothetical protein